MWYFLLQSTAEWAPISPSDMHYRSEECLCMPLQGHWVSLVPPTRSRKLQDILTTKELNSTTCGQVTSENIQQSLTYLKKGYAGLGGGLFVLNMRFYIFISIKVSWILYTYISCRSHPSSVGGSHECNATFHSLICWSHDLRLYFLNLFGVLGWTPGIRWHLFRY